MDELQVPAYKFDEMCIILDAMSLADGDKVKHTCFYDKKEYIITSATGTGRGNGYDFLEGYRVEVFAMYKGTLKPLLRGEHWQQVELGRRQRTYQGRLIKHGVRKLVVCEPHRFFKTDALTQTSLF
ncbi:hypothetical protein [Emticicia sp. W12TSBA100-4]|uniref:hypothetical protein n=1 Tax=Emticicia sp. W12TSBA100-4 TaxID=3160965 RepID=UPI003306172A